MKTLASLLAFSLGASTLHAATTNFYDGTFNPSDWTNYDAPTGLGAPTGCSQTFQVLTGGNPGAYQLVTGTYQYDPFRCGDSFHINKNAVFSPLRAAGGITNISFSIDTKTTNVALAQELFVGAAAFQNGAYFAGPPLLASNLVWNTLLSISLVATNFYKSGLGVVGENRTPDFTATAAPISFGYYVAFPSSTNPSTTPEPVESGQDNWTVTINPAPVIGPPMITQQPQNQVVNPGQTATFSVSATSTVAMSCQWEKDGTNLAGATGTTLTLQNVTPADGGTYTVVVSNSGGTVASSPATLTVTLVGSSWYLLQQPGVEIISTSVGRGAVTIAWAGGLPEYLVQSATALIQGLPTSWMDVVTTCVTSVTLPATSSEAFFRVVSLGDPSAAGSPALVGNLSTTPGAANAIVDTPTIHGFGVNGPVSELASGALPLGLQEAVFNPTTTPLPGGYPATIVVQGMNFVVGATEAGYSPGGASAIAFQCTTTSTPSLGAGQLGYIDFTLGGPGCPPLNPIATLPCGLYLVTVSVTVPLLGACGGTGATTTLTRKQFLFVPSTDQINIDVVLNPDGLPCPTLWAPGIAFCGPQAELVGVYPLDLGRCGTAVFCPGPPQIARTHSIIITTFPNPNGAYFVNTHSLLGVGPPLLGDCDKALGVLNPNPSPPPMVYNGNNTFDYFVSAFECCHGLYKPNGNCMDCGAPLPIGFFFSDVSFPITVIATDGCSFATRDIQAAAMYEYGHTSCP